MGVIAALQQARLYGILDLGYVAVDKATVMAEAMLQGGVGVLQLRGKKQTREVLLALAKEVAPLCREHGVPFIINDHPELVIPTGADGVHIGQDDMMVAAAREMVGPEAIVGKSTHSLDQVRATALERPDYIGFGPLYPTPTKPDYGSIGLRDIAAAHALIDVPIFCIGGVKRENLPEVTVAGARRVVIVSGILLAADPAAYCEDVLNQLPR